MTLIVAIFCTCTCHSFSYVLISPSGQQKSSFKIQLELFHAKMYSKQDQESKFRYFHHLVWWMYSWKKNDVAHKIWDRMCCRHIEGLGEKQEVELVPPPPPTFHPNTSSFKFTSPSVSSPNGMHRLHIQYLKLPFLYLQWILLAPIKIFYALSLAIPCHFNTHLRNTILMVILTEVQGEKLSKLSLLNDQCWKRVQQGSHLCCRHYIYHIYFLQKSRIYILLLIRLCVCVCVSFSQCGILLHLIHCILVCCACSARWREKKWLKT